FDLPRNSTDFILDTNRVGCAKFAGLSPANANAAVARKAYIHIDIPRSHRLARARTTAKLSAKCMRLPIPPRC
ncbi:MAG: hypothetical protein ACRCUZ_04680, partial [Shewanella sp.]